MSLLFAIVLAATVNAPATDVNTTFKALKFREIGPAVMGGRIDAIAAVESNPEIIYVGTASGGVLKSTNGGTTWEPMFDDQPTSTIGDIAVSQSDPSVVWVGTGESNNRQSSSWGNGVYKSTDGGKTWQHVGLDETHHIGRIVISPNDPNTVYVAAAGKLWGPSKERGVYKTTDGGKTWNKVLFRNDSTGISDLVVDPSNPDVLYAAFWQAQRYPWKLVSGGQGGGLFKSTDGGEHWTEITHNPGLPAGLLGNVGLAISPAKPSRVWALIEADQGGVYRSDDGGATWRYVNAERKLRQRPWYYSRVFADSKDTNTVYALNVLAYKSTDGGETFKVFPDPHGDNHDMWIASNDP